MSTTLVCARYNEDINWLAPLINENIIIYNKGEDDLHIFPKNKVIRLPNLGREGGTFILYIIQNYHQLNEYTMFIQGNPVDHINCTDPLGSLQSVINQFHENKNFNFKYISTHFIHASKSEVKNYCSGIPHLGSDYILPIPTSRLIDKILNLPPYGGNDISNLIEELRNFRDDIYLFEIVEIMLKYPSFSANEGCHFRINEIFSLYDTTHLENLMGDNYYYGYGGMFIASRGAIHRHPRHFYENIYRTLMHVKPGAGWGLEKLWKLILDS